MKGDKYMKKPRMSREKAIKLASTKLKCLKCQTDKENPCAHWSYDCRDCKYLYEGTTEEQKEWLEMAIKALEQEPCEDVVSRQAVHDGMIKYGFHASDMTITEFVQDVLPPVTPKTKWIPVSEGLPKESGDYFVTVFIGIQIDTNKPVREVSKDCFSLSDGWSYYGEHVIAWQPLLTPYEPESEGE